MAAALDNCVQMSAVCAAAPSVQCNNYHQPFISNSKEKACSFPTSQGFKKFSISTSSSSDLPNRLISFRKPHILCKAREALDGVREVNDSSWKKLVIGSENPVLVEFWAPWCGPCRMIAPVIEELAKEYAGRVSCFKLNTDDCPNIASEYGIRSIPTVLFFRNGEKKESVIGAVPKSTLSSTINKYLET